MRRLKVLCIILLVTFLVSGVMSSVTDFVRGWNSGKFIVSQTEETGLKSREFIALDVDAVSSGELECTGVNVLTGDSVWIEPNNVSVYELSDDLSELSAGQSVLRVMIVVFNWLIVVIYLVVAVMFVRIMVRFTRAVVFDRGMIRLLKHIGWWFLVLAAVSTLWEVGRHFYASSLLDIDWLSVSYRNCVDWPSILIGLVVLVMTEILRHATSMKEEQDLTI